MKKHQRSAVCCLAGALALSSLGCDPDIFHRPELEFGAPAGALSGSVTYAGPLPCTAGGNILGSAVILAFDERFLPPPEGLGTSAAGLSMVSGEQLFRGIRDQLAFDPNGAKLCPPPNAAPVVVSAEWHLAPLLAGVYQVRGFYDYDANFMPTFSIFSLPTKGDLTGGAVDNAADVLQGAPPVFRRLPLGELQPDGSRLIGEDGAAIDGVAVTLALPAELDLPTYYVKDVRDSAYGNTDPDSIIVPRDYQLDTFSTTSPTATEASFIRLVIGAGVPPAELKLATKNPFLLWDADANGNPLEPPILLVTRQDVNGDGLLDGQDHIPETSAIPALAPQAIFNRAVDGDTASLLESQAGPSILLQGATLLNSFLQTAISPSNLHSVITDGGDDNLIVALRPAVICMDVTNPAKGGVLLNTAMTDQQGNPLVDPSCCSNPPTCTEPAAPCELEQGLSERFGREISVKIGCLPEGRLRLNLIYDSGQAWTVPNEAGVCDTRNREEALGEDACQSASGSRPRLRSQGIFVTIGAPQTDSYCVANPTPDECLKIEAPSE